MRCEDSSQRYTEKKNDMDLSTFALLIGRVVFGGYFIVGGLNHFGQLQGMSQMVAAKGLPAPRVAVLASGALLVLAGASIVVGLYPVGGLLGLVVFLLSAAILFHNFWTVSAGEERINQLTHFLKNVALAGAALMLVGVAQVW